MRIGPLREKITVQEYSATRDSYGGEVKTWATYATRWANVQSVSGREFFSSSQVNATVTTKFVLRYLEGLSTKMRISWDGRLFDIVAVLESGNDRMMTVMAEELVSA